MRAAVVNIFGKAGAVYIAILLAAVNTAKIAYAEMFGMEAKAAPILGGRAMIAYPLYPNWTGENTQIQ
jgi:hypothetical protein